ncbi:MAG: helix-turn-helix transcriptional regulator [Kiritimatiellae bacterium]|nr:helix-turn-helix transcriptional regulator [Kiritimatiellia bacterium]
MKKRALNMRDWLKALGDRAHELVVKPSHYFEAKVDWRAKFDAAPDHAMYLVVDSECRLEARGVPAALRTGTFVWLFPYTPFEIRLQPDRAPGQMLMVRFQLQAKGVNVYPTGHFILLWNAWEVHPLMERIVDEWKLSVPPNEKRIRRAITRLCRTIVRLKAKGGSQKGPLLNVEQRRLLNRYVREHVNEWPKPAELAALLKLSEDYFARVFHHTFGVSPRTWLMHQRIRLAALELTATDVSVTQVAYRFGYRDVYLFSRQFKQVVGDSPTAYRKLR